MCLAQGPQRSDAVRLEPAASRSRVKHSTTEPLRSLTVIIYSFNWHQASLIPWAGALNGNFIAAVHSNGVNYLKVIKMTQFCKERTSVRKQPFYWSTDYWAILVGNQIKCKNNHHICVFHCINTCRVPQKMFDFVWFDSLRPINNLSVNMGQVFLGWTSPKLGLMFLLKDTTQWHRWGSNLRPLGLESSTLPLRSGRCLNNLPSGLLFKQLPKDLASVNARKNHVWSLYHVMAWPICFWEITLFDLIRPKKKNNKCVSDNGSENFR